MTPRSVSQQGGTAEEAEMTKTEQVQGLRRSGAAGKHRDKRHRRARTRGAAKARALKEQQ